MTELPRSRSPRVTRGPTPSPLELIPSAEGQQRFEILSEEAFGSVAIVMDRLSGRLLARQDTREGGRANLGWQRLSLELWHWLRLPFIS